MLEIKSHLGGHSPPRFFQCGFRECIRAHMRNLSGIVFILILYIVGCSTSARNTGVEKPVFCFKSQTKTQTVSFSCSLIASETIPISLKPGVWGKIKWIVDEGAIVASGDLIAKIDMEPYEEQLRNRESAERHAREQLNNFMVEAPFSLGELGNEISEKERLLELRKHEMDWLTDGKSFSEKLRAKTDVEKAGIGIDHSQQSLILQKKVAERGFAAPHSVRTAEIEVQRREIELDYSERLVKKFGEAPLPEEEAKISYQTQVASGELWLAKNQLSSASTTRAIEQKRIDFQIEINSSQFRKTKIKLEQRELFAPGAGIVIFPFTWGRKAAVGQSLWQGMNFMEIVSTNSFILDAAVDEHISSILRVGASASILMDCDPNQPLFGEVLLVGKLPRRSFREKSQFKKFPVQLSVSGDTQSLRIGEKGKVDVFLDSAVGVFLPRDILLGTEASPTVKLWERGVIKEIPVSIEAFSSDFVKWVNPPASSGKLLYQ